MNLESLGGAVRIRSHTTDISVLGELIVGRSYESAADAAGAASTIVDLGANTGLAARWFLQRFPDAALVSVEPEDGNYALPQAQPRRARDPSARVCRWTDPERLSRSSGKEDGFQMVDNPAGPIRVVDMPTILEALSADVVDLLKVDIEGAERELFESCAGWIEKIRLLSVECHGDFSPDDLVALLHEGGVDGEIVDRSGREPSFGYETTLIRVSPGGV